MTLGRAARETVDAPKIAALFRLPKGRAVKQVPARGVSCVARELCAQCRVRMARVARLARTALQVWCALQTRPSQRPGASHRLCWAPHADPCESVQVGGGKSVSRSRVRRGGVSRTSCVTPQRIRRCALLEHRKGRRVRTMSVRWGSDASVQEPVTDISAANSEVGESRVVRFGQITRGRRAKISLSAAEISANEDSR